MTTGASVIPATCANCDAPLAGPYCSQCGQHVHDSARTVGALLHDGWHVVTHVDGRFWQTLATLSLRPGRLTVEYFAERRARYLPPVRVYLVLSVLFFAIASLTSHTDIGPRAAELAKDPAVAADLAVANDEVRAAVAAARARSVAAAAASTDHPAGVARERAARGAGKIQVDAKLCEGIEFPIDGVAELLHTACLRHSADNGRALLHAIFANIPKMMFVFLPLMAGVMLLLYWRPRRMYVEHLVFFLHTHAALFLMLIVVFTVEWLAGVMPALLPLVAFVQFAGFLYAVWYGYRALRTYYGQRRWRTVVKLVVVGFAYVVFITLTLAMTALFSFLTA